MADEPKPDSPPPPPVPKDIEENLKDHDRTAERYLKNKKDKGDK
jgi:hypothetical protein